MCLLEVCSKGALLKAPNVSKTKLCCRLEKIVTWTCKKKKKIDIPHVRIKFSVGDRTQTPNTLLKDIQVVNFCPCLALVEYEVAHKTA